MDKATSHGSTSSPPLKLSRAQSRDKSQATSKNFKKLTKIFLVLGFVLTCNFQFVTYNLSAQNELTADEILLKADEVRNPQLDFTTSAKVTSFKPNQEPAIATYEVMIKGRNRTVIKTISPPVDKGRVLLMLDKDLWAFLPEVSKPLRISFQERLLGEVANGDIARVNFTGDYTPEIIREEEIEGKNYYVLGLAAKSDDITYSRAILWVEKETFYPLKAEFYAVSGLILKTCSYESYKELSGRLRPTQLVMSDPIRKGQKSIIEYDNMQVGELPEKYFTKDYMKKFMQ
jgi:outer membrane lipoprotein-sorting protein